MVGEVEEYDVDKICDQLTMAVAHLGADKKDVLRRMR